MDEADKLAFDIFAIEFAIDDMRRQAVQARKDNQPFIVTLSWDGNDLDNKFKLTKRWDGREV